MRFLRDLRYRLFYGIALRRGRVLKSYGDTRLACNWNVCPDGLGPASIIYSGGVGNDITFERALVDEFGCSIVLLDPSPTGLRTMAQAENQNSHYAFHAVALTGHCGVLHLHEPVNAEEGSYYQGEAGGAAAEVPCTDLATLMREHGHTAIDLLKIDIEGSEYEVLDDILARRIPIRQICVEFHHGMLPGIRRSASVRAIVRLLLRGYHLLDQVGNNHTFVWGGRWPLPA